MFWNKERSCKAYMFWVNESEFFLAREMLQMTLLSRYEDMKSLMTVLTE